MCARQGRQGESGRSLASRVTRGVERVSSPHTGQTTEPPATMYSSTVNKHTAVHVDVINKT